MGWIGITSRDLRQFEPGGLDAAPTAGAPHLLASGTLLIEHDVTVTGGRQNILRYGARAPWTAGLTVCIDPDGTVSVLQGQGDRSAAFAVQTDLTGYVPETVIWFTWDGPARRAVLTVMNGATGALFQTEGRGPLPLSLTDAERILTGSDLCVMGTGHRFAAISDRVEPAGPGGTLDPDGIVMTPKGPASLGRLRPGHLIVTADGDVAQVRWCGSHTLPGAGRFAPLWMRAPYHGLQRDMIVAPDQQLCLSGAKVEYLFGEEAVRASARHLANGQSILSAPPRPLVRYAQVLLDRPAVFRLSGALVESMDPTPYLADAGLRAHSVLADMPDELMPRARPIRLPALRGFEALTLAV